MNRTVLLASITFAFVAGATATCILPAQKAEAANEMTPMVIHVPELQGDALGMASGTGLRSKAFVIQDGMTLAVQAGPVGHGSTKTEGAPFKAIAIKTPPQAPDDIKLLN
jgi:hypothetical protein